MYHLEQAWISDLDFFSPGKRTPSWWNSQPKSSSKFVTLNTDNPPTPTLVEFSLKLQGSNQKTNLICIWINWVIWDKKTPQLIYLFGIKLQRKYSILDACVPKFCASHHSDRSFSLIILIGFSTASVCIHTDFFTLFWRDGTLLVSGLRGGGLSRVVELHFL